MKLYLSSYRVPTPDDLYALLAKPPQECRVGIITNAKDEKTPEEREVSLTELQHDLGKLSLRGDLIDLQKFNSAEETKKAITGYDLLFGAGGNVFLLRYVMKKSGFDQIVRGCLESGMVYAGESAGAMVMGASIEKAEIVDDHTLAPEVIYEGIGLVDKILIPHVGNTDFGGGIQAILDHHADDDRLVPLTDQQALIVDGSEIRVVSGGAV